MQVEDITIDAEMSMLQCMNPTRHQKPL